MKKILVIGTGGTIACVRQDSIRLDRPFKILDYCKKDGIEFECASPYCVLSENTELENWRTLIEYLLKVDFDKYLGVIILHGSDTLAFTGAILGNIFYDKAIVLVASDKPIEDESANGIFNFQTAVDFLHEGIKGVFISYNSLYRGTRAVSANDNDEFISSGSSGGYIKNPRFAAKNILIIRPYIGISYDNYCIDGCDAVLHTMYHSATAPGGVKPFIKKCREAGVPFYFVTAKSKAEYEIAADFDNIIFGSTLENAYARLLLTDGRAL